MEPEPRAREAPPPLSSLPGSSCPGVQWPQGPAQEGVGDAPGACSGPAPRAGGPASWPQASASRRSLNVATGAARLAAGRRASPHFPGPGPQERARGFVNTLGAFCNSWTPCDFLSLSIIPRGGAGDAPLCTWMVRVRKQGDKGRSLLCPPSWAVTQEGLRLLPQTSGLYHHARA